MQLELAAPGVRCRLQLLDLLGQHLGRLHGLGCLCDLGLLLGERRAGLLVVGRAYLPGRFRLLLLVFGLRVALLPLLLFALRLRTILPTIHGDRFPYPVGKEKACSRFHVGNRLLVRHKWKRRWGLGLISLNGYLEEQCEAVANHEKGFAVELSTLCGLVKEKADYNEADFDTYVSTESLLPGKKGRQAPSSLPQTGKVTVYKAGDILVSNIRPYFKKIWYADRTGTCSGDVLVFRAKQPEQSGYLYSCMRSDAFFDYVMKGAKGTKMPRGDKKQMLTYKVASNPSGATVDFIESALSQASSSSKENHRLAALRDNLLPKLMSGEIDVSKVDLKQLNSHLGEKSIDDILRCTYQSHLPFNFSAYLTGRKFLVCRREDVLGCKQRFPTFLFMHIGTCLFQR